MTKQFSTFYIGGRLYGLDVMAVQEVTKALPTTKVPLAPKFVRGLINLRGQVATAVALKNLFDLPEEEKSEENMNVVCRGEDMLLSFVVDEIGDVIEVDEGLFEPTPDTVSESVKRFMSGVYKTPGDLLSILEIKKITDVLQK